MYHYTQQSVSTLNDTCLRTILVVDDEESIRMMMAEFLQDCGYNVLEAGNVAEARTVLISTPVDLVFSDINMPGGESGFDLAKWVCGHQPDTKVILTSGYPQASADTRDLAETLIRKPYSCEMVLQRIQRLF